MSDIGSSSERTELIINAQATGFEKAIAEMHKLRQAHQDLQNSLNKKVKATSSISTEMSKDIASTKTLASQVDRLTSSYKKKNQAANVGIAGMTAERRATKAGAQEYKDYTKSMEQAGRTVISNAQSFDHAGNNLRKLSKVLGDSRVAGIANLNTMKSLGDGIERVGGRGLNSFEQMRMQMFSFGKDMNSVAFNMQANAKKMQWTGRTMFTNITLPVTLAIGTVVKEFISFEKQVFQLQKVLEFKGDFGQLRKEIQDLAVDMGMSQTATAGLFRDIAALGVAPVSLKGWAEGISQISALGDVELSSATEFFRTTAALFGPEGGSSTERLKETNELMAKMNAIADETSLQLKDLADAFPEVAPVMKQMGLGADDVAASLAGMYKRGIPASEAAHALKFGMQRLLGPTKTAEEYLTKMGYAATDFADMSGAAFGQNAIEKLASSLMSLPLEEKQKVIGELFGKRQAARMTSWAEDLTLGLREVEAAMSDGVIKAEEMNSITSDYARSMIAAQSDSIDRAGIVLDGFDDPMKRFTKAVDMFKESPGLQWDRLKTMFKKIMVDLGAIITPTVLEWGDKFISFLGKLTEAPPHLLKIVSILGALAAAFGPVIIAASAMQSVFAGSLKIFATIIPKGRMMDILPGQAMELMGQNPNRKDIVTVGPNTFQKKGRFMDKFGGASKDAKESVASATNTAKIKASTEAAELSAKELQRELFEATVEYNKLQATGAKSAASLAASNKLIEESAENARKAVGAQSIMNPYDNPSNNPAAMAAAAEHLANMKAETAGMTAAAANDPRMKAKKRLFGNVDDAKKSGQLQGMTYGRWFGKNADESLKGWKAKSKALGGAAIRPRRTVVRALGSAGKDAGASIGEAGSMIAGSLFGKGKAGGAIAGKLGMFSKLAGILPALKVGFLGVSVAGAKVLATIGVVVAVVGAFVAVIYSFVKSVTQNWDKIQEKIKPSIETLKKAFGGIKDAVMSVIDTFKGAVMGTAFEVGEEKAKGMSLSWETAASVIEGAINAVTSTMNFIAGVIRFTAPLFVWLGKIIGATVGFIGRLFKGDFADAFWFLVYAVFSVYKPIVGLLDGLGDIFLSGLQYVARLIGNGVMIIAKNLTPIAKIAGTVAESIAGLFGVKIDLSAIKNLDKTVAGFFATVDSGLASAKKFSFADSMDSFLSSKLNKFGGENLVVDGPEINPEPTDDSLDNLQAVVSEATEDGAEEGTKDGATKGLENASDEILKNFLSVLKPRVRKQMDLIRETLIEQFDKAVKSKLQAYDDQIAAIEKAEKAEEKLLRAEEYVQRKRELMYKRSLDIQNYQRNRALAIYEGRISDVRQLDLDFTINSKDYNKNLTDIENDRQRDIIKDQRDAQREQINAARKFEEDRLAIAKKGFEDQLDLILEFEPRTVGEFENMLNQLRGLNSQFNIDWPTSIKTGGEYYLQALAETNNEIVKQFGWGGEAGYMAWVAPFIDTDTIEALYYTAGKTASDSLAAGYGDGAAGGGVGGDFASPSTDPAPAGPAGPTGPVPTRLAEPTGPETPEQQAWRVAAAQRAWQDAINNRPLGTRQNPIPQANRDGVSGAIAQAISNRSPWLTNTVNPFRTQNPMVQASQGGSNFNNNGFGTEGERIQASDQARMDRIRNESERRNASNPNIRPWTPTSDLPYSEPTKITMPTFGKGQSWTEFQDSWRSDIEQGESWTDFQNSWMLDPAGQTNTIDGPAYTTGQDIVFGMWGGVESVWDSFISQLKWYEVTDSAKDEFDNRSPSKVFMQIGRDVIEGFVLGFFEKAAAFPGELVAWIGRSIWSLVTAIPGLSWSVVSTIARMPGEIISALGDLGSKLWGWASAGFNWLKNNLPGIASGVFQWFKDLPGNLVGGISNLGGKLWGWAKDSFNFLRDNLPSAAASVFNWFKDLPGLLWDGVKAAVDGLGGLIAGPAKAVLKGVFGFHTGGIVGQTNKQIKPSGKPNEVSALLLKGEGVLPVSAMKKIGPQAFELLRRGMIGDVVKAGSAGKVFSSMPKINAIKMPNVQAQPAAHSSGGDVFISVDTFIGEEQWFKSMADKYDMKVSARKAKANGSQSRIISSYNSNERNTYK